MNGIQTQNAGAAVVAFLAGLLAGKGVFGFDAATWTAIVGGVGGAAAAAWGAIAARKSAVVSTAAAAPEVKEVILDARAPGVRELNAATPSNVKVAP